MLTTVIGAYPKPNFLKIPDWFNEEGGTDTQFPTKNYTEALEKLGNNAELIFLKATKEVIQDQEKCGIDIITDGEIRRENYIHYHCRYLNGIDFKKLTEKSARTGNYKCWLPTITKKITAKEPFLSKEWVSNQKLTKKPIKVTIPGPMTIADTIGNSFYKNDEEMGIDLAKAINIEIKRLEKAGCKYIQVDEPLFARKPENAIAFGIRNLERCFDGIDSNKVERITHICCGYPDKLDAINYPKAPLESYNKISTALDKSIIDTVSIEDAHRYNNLEILKKFKNTKIIIGLIKIASSKIESFEEINQRINKALRYISKEQLIAAPDCGLGHLPRQLAISKLKVLVEAVKEI
ncbi:MAG: 5-methyltetrahydropteroyltriglutamate--homocysteine methyltransferase [Alphaproteobacteria bacterium MarineAlpha5_Bin9]|nr:MAG: 5-methyltetrahydropteroyltriglutamate--homocysteine methyltransferase [Alphaproteobacteria bacterium MarineAlpha5_Bin9]|tara:strand:+ start:985 stop:2034 length:1050 start_codon:yes stop_codon:yes gene_type:complete